MLKFYPLLYAALVTLCSGFVLISSAADGSFEDLPFFTLGKKLTYKWRSGVWMNEAGAEDDEGFHLEGKVNVSPVWRDGSKWLVKFELLSPTLSAKSKKPKPYQSPLLKSYNNQPFAAIINKGIIEKLYIGSKEETVLKNIKKAIASLFQFNPSHGAPETDISGRCKVSYKKSNSKYVKSKTDCTSDQLDNHQHLDQILGTGGKSSRLTEYSIHEDSKKNLISSTEKHVIKLQAKEQLGGTVAVEQELTYDSENAIEAVTAEDAQEALKQLKVNVAEENLMAEDVSSKLKKKQFSKEVALLKEHLKTEHLGSEKSAKALLQLLEVAKTSDADDISKTLASKKNAEILEQLYDILGFVQTENTHKAVMKHIHLDDEEQINLVERYLWALSFAVHPNLDILEDLVKKFRKNPNIPDKVRDTLVLTLGSMARRATQKDQKMDHVKQKIINLVEETIINSYDYAKDQERHVYLNALKNLKSPSTLSKLISVLNNGTQKEEVLAWRAIKAFGKPYWSEDILARAEKTLFQLDRKHDTSARCLAVDVLLQNSPVSDDVLEKIVHFVAKNDSSYEIRQYAFQSIQMLADKCPEFEKRVKDIVKGNPFLNNYSSLAPRGLSTALTRSIYKGTDSRGHLVSLQEIKGGLVKRGVVDVVLDNYETTGEIFTLGIFAGGLSSFASDTSEEEDDPEEAEDSSTGMELTILGTQIRPFVFFESQGELMGLVWSGTASEMTPAFQALILVQDHEDVLRLGNGFIVKVDVKGALSFDLSGKMEVSLWSRTAQSLIKKAVAYSVKGLLRIDTPLVKKELSFEAHTEPELNLELDADVSGKAKLCMRLSQPNSVFRRETVKKQSFPGTDYQARKTVKRKMEIPGVTYAINRKNNENCAAMFNS